MTTQTMKTAAETASPGFRRLNYASASPKALQAMLKLSGYPHIAGLDPVLLELFSLGASQINGCGFCLDMLTKELRANDVSEQALYLISVWREAPSLYSSREKTALAWTEALTTAGEHGVPDETYQEVRTRFSEAELVDLSIAIVAICAGASITCPVRH